MNRRNLALGRRVATILAAVAAMVVMVVSPAQAQPARAADLGAWGNIDNNLPSYYPVKIADFGDSDHYCHTINAGDQGCREWWLPSGMNDTELRGWTFDTDGFKVENVSQYYVSSYGWVPGNVWFRIHDYHEVNCYMSGNVPYCHVYVI
jgi:hypothetical protein